MRNLKVANLTGLGLAVVLAVAGTWGGCGSAGSLATMPFARITAVQLFDQPNYTVAFTVEGAVNNPSLISKINWVFGDGGGFVEGPAGRATISHKYAAVGTYAITAYVFSANQLAAQIEGSVTVVANGDGATPAPGDLPGAISGPNPRDKATNVDVTTKLTWTGGAKAASHDVYLGTVKAEVENATPVDLDFRGTLTTTSYDPGGLTPDKEYFWRIDERNTAGVTKGTVLSFTTAKAPTKAKNFVPVNGAGLVPVEQVLQWTAGSNTSSHDVYFGKNQADVTNATKDTTDIFKGNQTGASYDPSDDAAALDGQLLASTTYYWRIDEVGLGGTVKGDVLSFTTADPPPAITNPSPADFAFDVNVNGNLSWSAVPAITSFDVYFGTDAVAVGNATHGNAEFKRNQTSKAFTPSALFGGTVYYWRIDTLGAGGTAKGSVLTFTTAQPPPQAVGPFTPADNATNVNVTTTLQWNVGLGGTTTGFSVYLSTSETAVVNGESSARKATLDVSDTAYDPTALSPDTEYFWKIDAIGPGGTTAGLVLRFHTGALPGQVLNNPSPANGARGVSLDVTLQWTAGVGADAHDVYFGTDQTAVQNATVTDAAYKGRQAGATFGPGVLQGHTTYYWRIDEVSPGGQTKGPVWSFTTAPGQASNPDPMHQDSGIALDVTLSWTAGAGAASHDVYFGTVEADVSNATTSTPGIYKGNRAGTSWQPPALLAGLTTYYWRIDEVGAPADGATKGVVWRFTTGAGQAAVPIDPVNGANGVGLSPTLTWHAGAGAASHDVYFGVTHSQVQNATTADSEYQGNQLVGDETFDVIGPLNGNTNYYWRIDELDAGNHVTKGSVWQFRTGTGPASNPTPANFAEGVDINADLSWTAGSTAASHNVYFGTAPPGVSKGNQTGTTYDPGTLNPGTTYYWRIDEVGPGGTTVGAVWQFTTGAGQASNPSPPDGFAGTPLAPLLTWVPGALAESQDVYFGTTQAAVLAATRFSAEFEGNQIASTFSPGLLSGMTFYYWRIDTVTAAGTTKGKVWQFRTGPGKATTPIPADFAVAVAAGTLLKWTAGVGAVSHDVYFSTSLAEVTNGLPAAFRGNQAGTIFDPGAFAPATTYYWRIDEVAANGTTKTTGDVWRFTTAP